MTPLRVSADYRRIVLGLGVSNVGQQMTAVAVGIQVYAITQSSFAVGLVGLFQLVPLIGFGLYGGALSDTHDRRRLGLVAALGLMACSTVLAVQALLGSTSVALLYGVVAVQSGFFAVGNPARQAIIPRLVGPELLPAANALGMLAWAAGFSVGPLLGGLVIAASGGVTAAYVCDVVAFTAVVYAMWRLRPVPPQGDSAVKRGWAGVRDGLTFLRGKKNLQMSFYVDIAAMVFGMPRALFPAIAASMFPTDPRMAATAVGLLSAAPAVGAVLSGVLSGPLGHVRRQGLAIIASIMAWGLSIAAFGLAGSLWLACLLLAVAGAADNVSAVFRSTILQAATPDEYRGRLQGVFTVVVAGGPRLGDVESGTVAALFGETVSVVSGGLACVAVTLALVAAVPQFLRYDARHPVP
ncbi:MAG: MFS transporter [Frankiales bacterium]|nr:MFS transporter [Frankiales bacterium]